MSHPATTEMDVDAFLLWGEGRDGRWELRDGQPVLMSPERALHALTKYAAQEFSKPQFERLGSFAHVSRRDDGPIAARTAFEPDALVVCPPPATSTRWRFQTRSSSWRSCHRARLLTITGSSSTAIFRLGASITI